ncbi:hypothetical protein J3454_06625 [Erythrobacter sp. NFXS35]|uniref:hypothetical protein n=1 Tax=Erythrobacter sp. NFXS35 TaxID=2818436 RepID=UPI0032DE76D2
MILLSTAIAGGWKLRFFVHSDQTRQLLEKRFGGIENFVDEWIARGVNKADRASSSKSVKSVYRWIAQGLPKNEETFFGFFGALGVDPLSLLDLERSKFRENFSRYRQAMMLAGIDVGGFRPLMQLMRPAVHWPADQTALRHFGRPWFACEFKHDAIEAKNVHVTVRLQNEDPDATEVPRVYHIAYRRKSNADGLWRPFGSIISRSYETILVHENGDIQEIRPDRSSDRVEFKTFFGPSPAEFRVASIFDFSLDLDLYDDPDVRLQFDG